MQIASVAFPLATVGLNQRIPRGNEYLLDEIPQMQSARILSIHRVEYKSKLSVDTNSSINSRVLPSSSTTPRPWQPWIQRGTPSQHILSHLSPFQSISSNSSQADLHERSEFTADTLSWRQQSTIKQISPRIPFEDAGNQWNHVGRSCSPRAS